jgi:hypothetical protein
MLHNLVDQRGGLALQLLMEGRDLSWQRGLLCGPPAGCCTRQLRGRGDADGQGYSCGEGCAYGQGLQVTGTFSQSADLA